MLALSQIALTSRKAVQADPYNTAAVRALRNPELFKYEHYRQAVIAVAAGLIIRLLIEIPVFYFHTVPTPPF